MNQLRHLNFDDLLLLKLLLEGLSLTAIAKRLSLTQPAVTQKVRKMEDIFGTIFLKKSGRGLSLTEEGKAICTRAAGAVAILDDLSNGSPETSLTIGTRPEIGRSWLIEGVTKLRQADPMTTYHLHFGSGEEVLALLGIGKIDAVLTSAPLTVKGYESIELVEETYVMVASPKVAKSIKTFDDLKHYTLIEHDRLLSLSALHRSKAQTTDEVCVGLVFRYIGWNDRRHRPWPRGRGRPRISCPALHC